MDKKQKLIGAYEEAGYELLALLGLLEEGTAKRNKERILRQVAEILNELTEGSSSLAAEILVESYTEGSKEATKSLMEQGLEKVVSELKSQIHQRAVQAIMDDLFYSILEATDHMAQDVKDRVEEVVKRANERSLIQGVSRQQATRDAIAELSQHQITGMIARNGAHIPAEKYMAGVIQYHQRKAHVEGSINRFKENGVDLVYVNRVGITCPICAVYQGRVYSISGNDSRFPRLERRPPYHSHCVHSTSAYIEKYHPEEETKRLIELSNKPFEDTRTSQQIKRYEELQREKSRANETRKQWIRYKGRFGEDFPDLRTFASHKTRNTAKYQFWLEQYRELGVEIRKRESLT